MKIDINVQQQKRAQFVSSEMILRYLLGNDEAMDTLIMCKPKDVELVTTDQNVYEALGSIKPYDTFLTNKLTKFMEVVNIISFKERHNQDKPILKEERVEELREMALSKAKSQEE